jgi:hypothetical protein
LRISHLNQWVASRADPQGQRLSLQVRGVNLIT